MQNSSSVIYAEYDHTELTMILSKMEGSKLTWTQILKDPDYCRFSDEFPKIYTNHWLNNTRKFEEYQLPYMDKHVSQITQCLQLEKDDNFVDLTDNDHFIVAAVRKQIKVKNDSQGPKFQKRVFSSFQTTPIVLGNR